MRGIVLLVLIAVGVGIAGYVGLSQRSEAERVTLTSAIASVDPVKPGTLRVYAALENGTSPNRLVSVSSPEAGKAGFVGRTGQALVLPASARASLSLDGVYVELSDIEGALDEGRLIPISLTFEPSGSATTRARIEPIADPHGMPGMGDRIPHGTHEGMKNDPATHAMPPELSIIVSERADDTWQITLTTKHFTFTPEQAAPVHVEGEGHGHLYLNGLKLGRVYSEKLTVGALPSGQHEVTVSLNTNTHEAYMGPEGPVEVRAMILVE